ncbi:PH domain protein [Aspergillus lucknowensis]|uniref:PH domain-containing protein n=1 Tax=Aspergillus lucknowensis TaxID=176173 RepID=A0ABR4LGV3_9EURO
MSNLSSPVESPALPHRSSTLRTVSTGLERRASLSDDEAIPGSDSNETTNLLLERLRAWKHMCGYLEDYVSVTAKVQKGMSKDFEKVLKTVNEPLREGHHFSQSVGGVSSFFENIRANTQGMINLYTDGERNLRTSVLPTLEKLHKDIKTKSKELQTGASKGAKAVEKARNLTQKHIELLGQQTAALDSAAGNKLETSHDPYIVRRGIIYRLNKQVIEENNNRQDIIAVQNNFQQFEAHILQTVQAAMEQLVVFMSGQSDRQKVMYTDILATLQRIPPEFEWVNFITRNDSTLVDPDAPPRSLSNITFPNQDHRTTQPLIQGTLQRKSRTLVKGFTSFFYVITHARYLHEFKDNDDLRRDPSPELSLYLPDSTIVSIDEVKHTFTIKGKDVSSNVVGNAFHTNTEFIFKAGSASDAKEWLNVIKEAAHAPIATTTAASNVTSPVTSPASPAASTTPSHPPAYGEKESASQSPVSPPAVTRTNTTTTTGSNVAEKVPSEKTAEKDAVKS